MRVLLTGGGSGGHVNPAIAIADTIKRHCPDAEILFVGVKNGKESVLVPKSGYELAYIESQGIHRSLSLKNIKALYLAVTSPRSSATRKILDEFKPDIVIGTGGYVCWPLVRGAAIAGIPTMVHESNCKPGLAVKVLQSSVDTVLLNFPESQSYLRNKRKCVVVGNPIRGSFADVDRESARQKLGLGDGQRMVLVSAGSLGSQTINAAVLDMLRTLAPTRPETRFVLSTGQGNYADAKALYDAYELGRYANIEMVDYLYDMADYMAGADVVVSRAGAISLSELSHMGKAAIVIPSPNVADDHQLVNAKALSDRDAAVLVEERDFEGGALPRAVLSLLDDADLCRRLEKNIRAFADKDANELIYALIVQAVEAYHTKKK